MSNSADELWKLIDDSRLVPSSKLQPLRERFKGRADAGPDQHLSPLGWLVSQKVVSAYQSSILARGHSGPFRFGGYVVYDRIVDGPLAGHFRARHDETGYPVRLQFFAGQTESDLKRFNHLAKQCERMQQVRNRHLINVYECVILPEYRFLVFDDPPGKVLAERLPRKGRLPWDKAVAVAKNLADALSVVHRAGLVHGQLWPGCVWVDPAGAARLMWQIDAQSTRWTTSALQAEEGETAADYRLSSLADRAPTIDLYGLGALLYRMLGGRPPRLVPGSRLEDQLHDRMAILDKYQLPAELSELVRILLTSHQPGFDSNAERVGQQLGNLLPADRPQPPAPDPKQTSFEQALQRRADNQKFFAQLAGTPDTSRPDPEAIARLIAQVEEPAAEPRVGVPTVRPARRPRYSNLVTWLAVFACLAVMVALVAAAIIQAGNNAEVANRSEAPAPKAGSHGGQPASHETISPPATDLPGTSAAAPVAAIVQQVVADDGKLAWQSPTEGPPIDFSYVPSSSSILLTLRPHELLGGEEGKLLIAALGPGFEQVASSLSRLSGLEPAAFEQLIVSLHPNDRRTYSALMIGRLEQPLAENELLQLWKQPAVSSQGEAGAGHYVNAEAGYYLPAAGRDADAGTVKIVVFGEPHLVQQSLELAGADALGGALARLAEWTDRDRHLTLLFTPTSLANDEGQSLLSGSLATVRRPVALFFDDRIKGVAFSLHLDDACYLEMQFDRAVDYPAHELRDDFDALLRATRDRIVRRVAQLPDHPHWMNVRLRFDNMISNVYQNTRVAVENGRTIANCWLPQMAAHNLVAASELVLSSGSSIGTVSAVPEPSTPATIEALLEAPRSIEITSRPDLVNCIDELKAEINDQYPSLPFAFEIRLIGPDLLKEGITQNQRLGDLRMNNVPLADILTQIVVQANPDKNATSPRDEKCKLVWVVANDPDRAEQRIVLVTTRAAAREKGYTLPPAFQPE